MAFGTGVLIGAAAYKLLGDAVAEGGMAATGAGFNMGAAVFTVFDYAVSKRGASQRKRSGQAAARGYFFLDGASEEVMSAIAAFAGGGIIAVIASTMMPEAYEDSGPMTGLITALGLLTSLVLNQFS